MPLSMSYDEQNFVLLKSARMAVNFIKRVSVEVLHFSMRLMTNIHILALSPS